MFYCATIEIPRSGEWAKKGEGEGSLTLKETEFIVAMFGDTPVHWPAAQALELFAFWSQGATFPGGLLCHCFQPAEFSRFFLDHRNTSVSKDWFLCAVFHCSHCSVQWQWRSHRLFCEGNTRRNPQSQLSSCLQGFASASDLFYVCRRGEEIYQMGSNSVFWRRSMKDK